MLRPLVILGLVAVSATLALAQDRPAKELFGGAQLPAEMPAQPIGFYSRGCMAGGVQLRPDGPYWQAMRLSRNRQWGLPILIEFLEKLAQDAVTQDGWPGLLVGDLQQPRGGPMLTGHASHQVGLDADIWLTPMPSRRFTREEREEISAVEITEPGPHLVQEELWTEGHGRLIHRAALDPRVERIFVAPGIKKKLCETMTGDRSWLSKVRPYYGHNYHFHVRLSCPPGTPCKSQSPPPPGDGCGSDLAYWYTDEPYKQAGEPAPPPKPMMLSDLPPSCRNVLEAADRPGTLTMLQAFAAAAGEPIPAAVTPAMQAIDAAAPVDALETARLPRPRPEGF